MFDRAQKVLVQTRALSLVLLHSNSIEKSRPMGAELNAPDNKYSVTSQPSLDFSPQLSWSHYRVLMRVAKPDARNFYEREAIECGWDIQGMKIQFEKNRKQRERHDKLKKALLLG
jgi:hypothetical protein